MTELKEENALNSISQQAIAGEPAAIRFVNSKNLDDLSILEDIDKDQEIIKWFESRPENYHPLKMSR